MTEDELDNLLSNASVSADVSTENSSVQTSSDVTRPKLKKIKRPKIRPMPIMEASHNNITSEVPQKEVESSIIETQEEEPKTTSIVTANDAQNLVTNDNQYIMDNLPPDLDYLEDDAGNNVFIDSANYTKKSFAYMMAIFCLFIGLYIGKTLFSSETIENYGLEGVVTNPDVPAGRPRCGLTDKSQACVFYLMNWYKQELNGRDFYRLAAELTGREEYMIETDNLRYASIKIKPGNIAQLNIPALK